MRRSSQKRLNSAAQPKNKLCCPCGCVRCGSGTLWRRSVKRKVEEMGEFAIQGDFAPRVDVEFEVAALRDAVTRHQKKITDLCAELEQERAASASATTEAMSMILRLQREKAEVQMEARQFKRFAEEKIAHDQQELIILEDLVYKREQCLQALSFEVEAFRRRLISHGVNPDFCEEEENPDFCDYPAGNYPILNCRPNSDFDLEKYSASGSTPHRTDDLQDLERRIFHLEQTPCHVSPRKENSSSMTPNLGDEEENPDSCYYSAGNYPLLNCYPNSDVDLEKCSPSHVSPQKKILNKVEFPAALDGSDLVPEEDHNIDRIYTVDSVQSSTPTVRVCEEKLKTPTEFRINGEDTDIRKLYLRLQALEADRESMKQAILSMQTEKTQVLLKEIAQQIYSDAQPSSRPVRKLVKKQSFFSRFSLVSAVKWVASFVFWRKPPRKARYTFDEGRSGLLLLLENSPLWRQQLQRILSRPRSNPAIASGPRLRLKTVKSQMDGERGLHERSHR